MASQNSGLAEALAELQARVDGVKNSPLEDPDGNLLRIAGRSAITVPHRVMDQLLPSLPEKDWKYILTLREQAGGMTSREYPEIYLDCILKFFAEK